MKVTSPTADKIANRIKEMFSPCVFFITSFTDIASPDVVRKYAIEKDWWVTVILKALSKTSDSATNTV